MSNADSFWNHPVETLEKALHIRKQIAQLEEMLKELFGSPGSPTIAETLVGQYKGRRILSPEAKTRIAAAQRAKWAKSKADAPVAKGKKKKAGMSAEGRARIAAAQRARWAKQKATHGPETAIVLERVKAEKKGGMSAEGRARIAAAQKARWAKVRKAKK